MVTVTLIMIMWALWPPPYGQEKIPMGRCQYDAAFHSDTPDAEVCSSLDTLQLTTWNSCWDREICGIIWQPSIVNSLQIIRTGINWVDTRKWTHARVCNLQSSLHFFMNWLLCDFLEFSKKVDTWHLTTTDICRRDAIYRGRKRLRKIVYIHFKVIFFYLKHPWFSSEHKEDRNGSL